MGTIYQRTTGGTWYFQWYIAGKLHKKSLKTTDKATAKRLKTIYEAKLEAAVTGLAPKRFKFDDAFDRFLEQKQSTLKPGSLLRYREQVTTLKTFLSKKGVEFAHALTTDLLTQFVTERKKADRSPKTIREELTILQAVLKMLVADGLIPAMPQCRWPSIKVVTKRPERIGFYSATEVSALIRYFKGKEFHDLFLFLIFTGCRLDEARTAQVQDVRDSIIAIRNKKTETAPENQYRYLEIHPQLEDVITARTKDKAPDSPLFPEMDTHSRNWPREQLQAACKALNITFRRLHGIRHTFISSLLNTGTALRTVMKLVGHGRFDTTLRYAHVSQEDLKGKIGRISFGNAPDSTPHPGPSPDEKEK